MKKIKIGILALMAIVATLFGLTLASSGSASAGSAHKTFPYEVTVPWQMDNPNLTNMPINTKESNGPFEWPQTRLTHIPTPQCAAVKIQVDSYTIEDKADQTYLAGLKHLNSPSDDARLSPHNYYAEILQDKSKCKTKPCSTATVTESVPVPGPTTTVTETDTKTETAPPVTETATETQTVTAPPVTETATATETQTVTAPPVTETETQTVTAPPVTSTETQTVTAPPVTSTSTISLPGLVTTETQTVHDTATATETHNSTATATVVEKQTIIKSGHSTKTRVSRITRGPSKPGKPHHLASTGSHTGQLLGLAGILLIGGLALLALGRKKKAQRH